MTVLDPDAPLTPQERAELDRVCDVLWTSVLASHKIEGIEIPKDVARPDDAIKLSNREARRLIYPEARF